MAVAEWNGLDFDEVAAKNEKPMLIDFYATWCGPCRMLAPIVEEVSEEYPDAYDMYRADVDREGDLAIRFGISVIPTLVRIEGGKEVARMSGYCAKEELLSFLGL